MRFFCAACVLGLHATASIFPVGFATARPVKRRATISFAGVVSEKRAECSAHAVRLQLRSIAKMVAMVTSAPNSREDCQCESANASVSGCIRKMDPKALPRDEMTIVVLFSWMCSLSTRDSAQETYTNIRRKASKEDTTILVVLPPLLTWSSSGIEEIPATRARTVNVGFPPPVV